MQWKPNKWIGAALSLFGTQFGLGLFYVGAPRAAIASAMLLVAAVALPMALSDGDAAFVPVLAVVLLTVALTFWLATRAPKSPVRKWYSKPLGLVGIILIYSVICMALRAFLYEPFMAVSVSMTPTLPPNTRVLVQKWGYGHYSSFGVRLLSAPRSQPLARGDIVVFDYPKKPESTFLMRLIGLPGDKVAIRQNRLTINGVAAGYRTLPDYLMDDSTEYFKQYEEALDRAKYSILQRTDARPYPFELGDLEKAGCSVDEEAVSCTVPKNHYFVMGDNRDDSNDSRMFGYVAESAIIGKVIWHRKGESGAP